MESQQLQANLTALLPNFQMKIYENQSSSPADCSDWGPRVPLHPRLSVPLTRRLQSVAPAGASEDSVAAQDVPRQQNTGRSSLVEENMSPIFTYFTDGMPFTDGITNFYMIFT